MIWLFPFILLYQIYIPTTELPAVPLEYIYLSMYFVFMYCSLKMFKWLETQKILIFYLLFLFTLILGLTYSPDKTMGIQVIFYQSVGLFAISFGFLCRERNVPIDKIFSSIVKWGTPIAIVNILFFIFPSIEGKYLHSLIAQVFVEPMDIVGVYDIRRNNIIDPYKSGTFFTNTNEAAVFYQILFWMSFSLFLKKGNRSYLIISVFYLLAILTAYSRAGMLSLAICILITITINIKRFSFWKKFMWFFTPIAGLFFILSANGFFTHISGRFQKSTIEDDPRVLIWEFIWELLKDRPILGLGFGGWENTYPNYALSVGLAATFPPHNLFVHLWTWCGVLGVLVFLLMFIYIFSNSLKYYFSGDVLQLSLICSLLTVAVQGMFDNWFLNDFRISSLLYFLVGILMYRAINSRCTAFKNERSMS